MRVEAKVRHVKKAGSSLIPIIEGEFECKSTI